MTARALSALLLLASGRGVLAAEPPTLEGREADTSDSDLARRMKAAFASDPAKADALAARILRSSLGPRLTEAADPEAGSRDPQAARAELRAWVMENPAAAAHLAVGFARDDAEGTDAFERSLYKRAERFLELSPERNKGILGRLDGLGKASKALKADEGMSDDDRRKLMKDLFEGQGQVNASASGGGRDPKGGPASGGGGAVADDGVYDRLSALNPTGYSPQVLTLQSELNRTAPPGAPRLVETGKLDYATLVFPAHPVRYDLERLEAALAREEAAARAAVKSEPASVGGAPDTGREKGGRGAVGKAGAPPSLARRREALARARAAHASLLSAAEPAKSPTAITPALIKGLSARRRDAAIWLQIASLEELKARLQSVQTPYDDRFAAAVDALPIDPSDREGFLRGGVALFASVDIAVNDADTAITFLRAGGDMLARAGEYANKARAAGRRLPGDVATYRRAPGALAAALTPMPRWRVWAEDLALRFHPRSEFAVRAAARRRALQAARADFARFVAQ